MIKPHSRGCITGWPVSFKAFFKTIKYFPFLNALVNHSKSENHKKEMLTQEINFEHQVNIHFQHFWYTRRQSNQVIHLVINREIKYTNLCFTFILYQLPTKSIPQSVKGLLSVTCVIKIHIVSARGRGTIQLLVIDTKLHICEMYTKLGLLQSELSLKTLLT